jgi:hypothetical protein
MANLDAVEKAKRYATDKYQSQRVDLCRKADTELAQTKERLGRAGLRFSSSMDRAVGDNRAALVRDLVQARVDSLIDGFEINSVPIIDVLEQFIVAEAEKVHSIEMEHAAQLANSLGTTRMGVLAINTIKGVEFPEKAIRCQIEERRARPKSAPQQPAVSNVYHLSGENSRVNYDSADSSVNIVVKNSSKTFRMVRETIRRSAPPDEQPEILRRLDLLEQAQGTSSFTERYKDFIATAANHITLIAPFLPALSELIDRIPK